MKGRLNIQTLYNMEKELQLLLSRARMYQLFSLGFLEPSAGYRDIIKICEENFKPIKKYTLENLEQEYRSIFGHTISKEYPPYETQYGSSHIFMQSNELADIAGFYKAFGLDIAEKAHERCDHISVELEFMSFLVFKEYTALKFDGADKAEICHEAQQKFFREHLGRWLPIFIGRLTQKHPETFYALLGQNLKTFLIQESKVLNVSPSELRPMDLSPVAFEPEGDCFSCGASDICETFSNNKEEL